MESLEPAVDQETSAAPLANGISSNGVSKERWRPLPKPRRRKHKIIIHSSPFQRCIETSIAISAGLAQYQGTRNGQVAKSPSRTRRSPSASSRHAHGHVPEEKPFAMLPESADNQLPPPQRIERGRQRVDKACLRLDAFLGEWLSPDYYESITPPPGSLMMLAGAKADLLRRESLVESSEDFKRSAIVGGGHFPGGWANQAEQAQKARPAPTVDDDPLSTMAELGQSLPQRDRASSYGSTRSTAKGHAFRGINQVYDLDSSANGYAVPTPRYAVSPQEPIPHGYVGHARDACVDVDYQWDSLRAPLDWGNGGGYGEEWSAMHRRFRHGLAQMIAWYSTPSATTSPVTASPKTPSDVDTDTVLILVTHGAGCNALIGALTNQPVLLDVGMASLTLAVRHEHTTPQPQTPPPFSMDRSSSLDTGLSQYYTLRLIASTDHLRTTSSPLPTPSSAVVAPPARPRYTISHPLPSIVDEPPTGSFLSPRAHQSMLQAEAEQSTAPVGLWTLARRTAEVLRRSLDDGGGAGGGRDTSSSGHFSDDDFLADELPTSQQRGLWGAPDAVVAAERDKRPKRRWTVTEDAVLSTGLGA